MSQNHFLLILRMYYNLNMGIYETLIISMMMYFIKFKFYGGNAIESVFIIQLFIDLGNRYSFVNTRFACTFNYNQHSNRVHGSAQNMVDLDHCIFLNIINHENAIRI